MLERQYVMRLVGAHAYCYRQAGLRPDATMPRVETE